MKNEKTNRHYFTRKNFIAFSLVAMFSILMVFVALCIDHSANSILSSKNPILQFSDQLFGVGVEAGIFGLISVLLIAIYIVVFAVAFVFERRYAYINGQKRWSGKMIAIYLATLIACVVLSLGLGLVLQAVLDPDNLTRCLIFLGESLVVSLIVYAVLFVFVGSVVMLIVNFRKVNKPFEFFEDQSLEDILESVEATPVAENFDEQTDEQKVAQNLGFGETGGVGVGGVGAGSGTATVSSTSELEAREIVFPGLSSIDEEYEGYVADKLDSYDINLKELCEGFRNYLAQQEKLYYEPDVIRMFICGLNATRLILLEGLSGTGKSSLPRYFAKYVSGKATFVPVQATWRDRTNLLGYFNDFSKTYAETDFLQALYEANYDEDRINLFVLDELNISRVEYYFADFLSVLEYPAEDWKLRVMQLPVDFLPPVKLEEGFIRIPENSYFIGTANKDDSTFAIADKVYDRSIPIDFENRNFAFEVEGEYLPIVMGRSKLQSLFDEAEANADYALTADDIAKFTKITNFIYETFDIAFGNRVLNQIVTMVPTYIACGGAKEEVLDFMLARKVLVKLEGRFEDYIKDGLKQLQSMLENVYQSGTFKRSEKEIESLLKKL